MMILGQTNQYRYYLVVDREKGKQTGSGRIHRSAYSSIAIGENKLQSGEILQVLTTGDGSGNPRTEGGD
jgi:hypothetical protein